MKRLDYKKIAFIALSFGAILILTTTPAYAWKLGDPIVPCAAGACTFSDLYQLVYNVINFGIGIALILAVVYVFYGGILLMISGGSDALITKGKSAITSAVFGLFIILISYLIVNTIIEWFTDCAGNWYVFGTLSC